MTDIFTTRSEILGPISSDWTLEELLDWIAADDALLSDPLLRRPLRAVEEALTGTRWTVELDASLHGTRAVREPAIVSLVRSIALRTNRRPALRARTVAEVLTGHPSAPSRESGPSGAIRAADLAT
ncbi:hypothetical protein [Microbacterium tumbae]